MYNVSGKNIILQECNLKSIQRKINAVIEMHKNTKTCQTRQIHDRNLPQYYSYADLNTLNIHLDGQQLISDRLKSTRLRVMSCIFMSVKFMPFQWSFIFRSAFSAAPSGHRTALMHVND